MQYGTDTEEYFEGELKELITKANVSILKSKDTKASKTGASKEKGVSDFAKGKSKGNILSNSSLPPWRRL
eukprot:929428-Karenia_brevis.AAC.1